MQQNAGLGWIDRVATIMIVGGALSFVAFITLWLMLVFDGWAG